MSDPEHALKASRAVIIPAYRPDERLIGLAADVLKRGYSVLVVNDGSGEAYDTVFQRLDSRVTVLTHEKNRGKGAAIKTALAFVQERNTAHPEETIAFLCIMDADGQHLPADMERVMAAAAENPHKLALGVREVSGKMPLRSRMGNAITRGVFHLLTGTRVSDTQTGLRAFSADMIPRMLTVEGDRYEYEMGVLTAFAHSRQGFAEVPIATLYEDRKNSTSHFRVVRDSFRIYRNLLKFAGSSLIAFLVDYGCFNLLLYLLLPLLSLPWDNGYDPLVANVTARLISGSLNYYLNCRYVFGRKPSLRSAGEYVLLALAVLAVNSGVLYLFDMIPGMPVAVCKLLTEICIFFGNYIVQKKIIFPQKNK